MSSFIHKWVTLDHEGLITVLSEDIYSVQHKPDGLEPDDEKKGSGDPVTVVFVRPGVSFPIPDKEKKLYETIVTLLKPHPLFPQ